MKGPTHPAIRIAVTIIAFIVFILTLILSFLGNVPIGVGDENSTENILGGVFINTIPDLSARYPSNLNAASWTFNIIWPVIFLYNFVSVIYMLVSLCLPKDKSPIMREPALMPVGSIIFWTLGWALALSWIFANDREILGLAMFFILTGCWSTYVALGLSYRSYYKDIQTLEENSNQMLWLVRIIIHNGYGILAAWTTCAWKLMLATTITYEDSRGTDNYPAKLNGSLTSEDAGTISLSILLVEIIVWFILENFVFERYCRYTLSIYPTLIFAFSGVVTGMYVTPFSRNLILALVGLILVILAFFARVGLVIYRHRNRPKFA
uniref:uncharacterized protein LOC120332669 n=1 Tax=Styela clava TaxID=7725 RepID=UPI001939D17F|nr:uncharacterized protein LOC120332669 [Styela clava]